MWFSTLGAGACRYDGKTFTAFREDYSLMINDYPARGHVQEFFEDRDGILWIGCSGGLFYLDGESFINVTRDGPWPVPTPRLLPDVVLAGHTDGVWAARFSPDGSRILTNSDDGTARLWDIEGKQLAVLVGHTAEVRHAAFSPDGSRIITVSRDDTVRLWDSDGKPLAVLAGHTAWLSRATFSNDGSRIITTSADGTARLWDSAGNEVGVLAGHKDVVYGAEYSPDGSRIVTPSRDGTARLWDSDGKPLAVLADHTDQVLNAGFSPDGSRVVTASHDHTARLWDSEGNEIAVLAGHTSGVRRARFSPDGSRIVTASFDHTARLWDSEGKQLAVLVGHTDELRNAAFSPDGSYIVTSEARRGATRSIRSYDGTARLWDSEGKPLAVLVGHTSWVFHAEISPDGSRILTASDDNTARLYRVPATTHNSSTGPAASDAPPLLRFDYREGPGGMHNAGVRAIHEDSQGNFWFGTHLDGLARFDGHSYRYFDVPESRRGLSRVSRVQEDGGGTLWFDTGGGLARFEGERIAHHVARNVPRMGEWELEADDLWFAGSGSDKHRGQIGIYRYDGKSFTFLPVPVPEEIRARDDFGIVGIWRGNGARVWLATWDAVIGYDGKSFTIIDDGRLGHTDATGYLHVKYIYEDSRNRVWIGNNGIGVVLVDGDTITNFTQAHHVGRRDHRSGGQTTTPQPGDAPEGTPSLHRVFSIGEDSNGSIWFGTSEHGAWRYDGESLRQFTEKDGLDLKHVMSFFTDSRGDLLVGGKGVYKFNGESFDRIH